MGLILVVVLSFLAVVFVVRWQNISHLRRGISEIYQAHQAAMEQHEALQEELALQDDLAVIEEHARARLGLIKPGEEKIVFVEE